MWAGLLASIGWLAFGLIALRFSGVKRDRDKADIARDEQAKELKKITAALDDYRARMIARLKDLEDEISTLEIELNHCATPGARRNTLNRLLCCGYWR